jgi:hypothetical protein
MPRDATGNYTLPTGNPVVTGTTITSTWANGTMSDLAAAMTDSVSKSMDSTFATGKGTHTWNATAGGSSSIGPGNGDNWGLAVNDLKIASWYGAGFGPMAGGGPVPLGQYAWSVNCRTGDTIQAGNATVNGTVIGMAGVQVRSGTALAFYNTSAAVTAQLAPYTSGLGFINQAGNNWTFSVDNAGNANIQTGLSTTNVTANGQLYGAQVRAAQGLRVESGGIPITIQGGHIVWNEGGAPSGMSGQMTFVNNQGGGSGGFYFRNINSNNTVQYGTMWMEGVNGNFHTSGTISCGGSAATLSQDGNVNGSMWGGWLSNYLARYIQGNSQIQWASGIAEGAGVSVGGGGFGTSTQGAPWVQAGIRTNGSGNTLIYPQNVWLRT